MAESQGKGLKTPVNRLFQKKFEFGPLFGYDHFQNKIDTWETTVLWQFANRKMKIFLDLMGNLRLGEIF